MDLAVLYPNWGSYYDINSLVVHRPALPQELEELHRGQSLPRPHARQSVRRERRHDRAYAHLEHASRHALQAYENASVKYLLMPSPRSSSPGTHDTGRQASLQRLAGHHLQMPHTRHFFSTSSPRARSARPMTIRRPWTVHRRRDAAAHRALHEGLDGDVNGKSSQDHDRGRGVSEGDAARRNVDCEVPLLSTARTSTRCFWVCWADSSSSPPSVERAVAFFSIATTHSRTVTAPLPPLSDEALGEVPWPKKEFRDECRLTTSTSRKRCSKEESDERVIKAQHRLTQLRLFSAGLLEPQVVGTGPHRALRGI